jgi:hypothetical protein
MWRKSYIDQFATEQTKSGVDGTDCDKKGSHAGVIGFDPEYSQSPVTGANWCLLTWLPQWLRQILAVRLCFLPISRA